VAHHVKTEHSIHFKKQAGFLKIIKHSIKEVYYYLLYLLGWGVDFFDLSLASAFVFNNHGKDMGICFTNFSNNLNCL